MSTQRFATALSTDPDAARAEAEAVEKLRESLQGARPKLLTVFVSHHYGPSLEGLSERLKAALDAEVVIGCTGESIIGGTREIERGPALCLWAACSDSARLFPFAVRASRQGESTFAYDGLPPVTDREGAQILLFGDPFTFPMGDYLKVLNRELPGVPAFGGMASGGTGPGQNFLYLDDERLDGGAMGVVVEGGLSIRPVVSQGCRPVGKPYVITACDSNLAQKLGGKPAGRALIETLDALDEDDRALFQRMPFVGLAVDAAKSEFQREDFLVRGVVGFDQESQAIAIGDDSIRNGMTVQFLVRDAASASEDLGHLMRDEARHQPDEGGPIGALVFSCNGRGSRMFDEPDHDVGCVQSAFEREIPVAGFFAMGEIGPVGGQNFLHGHTASVAVFRLESTSA